MSKLFSKISDRFSVSSSGDEGGARVARQGAGVTARRREQVRRAQRTHRERKAEYVKTLEVEVEALRVKDAANTVAMENCMAMIEALKKALVAHNIQIPAEYDSLQAQMSHPPKARIDVVGDPQRLQASLPTSQSPTQQPPAGATFLNLQDPQLGIDFVLLLEQPCLPHFQPASPEDGDGHKMQFQAPIVARAPQSHGGSSHTSNFSPGSSWTVPTAELENQIQRLLVYSQSLSLVGELTPVMAWNRIQQHPQSHTLTRPKLDWLTSALVGVVACYGFGAVVDEQTFEQLLEEAVRGQ